MDPTSKTPRNRQELCLCAVFLSILVAPGITFALRPGGQSAILPENRRAAEFPARPDSALDWAAWPRAFESWHDDHFGLREKLLRAHAVLCVFVLHSDPSPGTVVGRDHWIFGAGTGIDLWRGAQPFTIAEMEAWRNGLESRQREFAKRGIVYRFVAVPSKSEIYPEYLPKRFKKGRPSRLEQLADHLAKTAPNVWIDIRASLLEEKARDVGDDTIYFPLGIHWNERGALAGTRAIVRELERQRPGIGAMDDTNYRVEFAPGLGDSQARQLYLSDLVTQRVRVVKFAQPAARELNVTVVEDPRKVVVEQDDPSLPRAVIFHDSFGMSLPPLLGRHFSHAVFLWEPDINLELIESEKPDIVLQVHSDRVLSIPPPRELDAAGDAHKRSAYQASSEVVLRFDATSNTPRIQCAAGGRVSIRGEGSAARVACETREMSDTFLLPEFSVKSGMHPILRMELESSVASSASLLFQTRTDSSYSRRRQVLLETHIGQNDVYAEFFAPDFAGRLMFRPAQEVGTFLIRSLEVRLVPN